MEEVKAFQVVENEWREQYDREWGLGIVLSVDQGDGYVWVGQIVKDEEGYYLTNQLVYRNKSKLRQSSRTLNEIKVELGEK